MEQFSRTSLLIGEKGLAKLAKAKVAIFGIGGVGSFAVEALARAGVGRLVLIDPDCVEKSNLNRQLQATLHSIGQPKVFSMKERVLSINPSAQVDAIFKRYEPSTAPALFCQDYDFVLDAVDDVSAKVDLIVRSMELHIPIISSMGAGNRLSADGFQVADISDTRGCPLARVVRRKLKEKGITTGVKVVFSPVPPIKFTYDKQQQEKRPVPGSISFVPPVAGLLMAGECVRDLLAFK
ncbi:MAG: tRNA threonylcarbamoyladenosine dehydratase [bacterium]